MKRKRPVVYLDGFEESLRLLVEREQYGDADIGMMFGVSYERVRQWREARGMSRSEYRGLFHIGCPCVGCRNRRTA